MEKVKNPNRSRATGYEPISQESMESSASENRPERKKYENYRISAQKTDTSSVFLRSEHARKVKTITFLHKNQIVV